MGENSQKRIVLASSSPRRRQLLSQLGIKFEVLPSYAEESCVSADPPAMVRELALRKASEVATRVKDALVIGADTIVVLGRKVLGKPTSPEEAVKMLLELQGKWHTVFTGVAVIDTCSGRTVVDCEATQVLMRPLNEKAVRAYVETGEPMDKAGSYAVQGLGAALVERIEGCFYNVVGLPIPKLCQILETFGVELFKGNGRRSPGKKGDSGASKYQTASGG
ncbi:MAG TPA: septum formation inhibitor Maf [Firmicutes bacterium]|nr:septum formation inhibitor Maf [Bacillota bacterium]